MTDLVQLAQLGQLGLFNVRVPRYTSYPTAPLFSDSVTASTVQDWLGLIRPGAVVSLYLHVPYCRRVCWFCACRTQGTASGQPVQAYVDTLLAELALLVARLPGGVTVSHLHWGGGTPTLLTATQIKRLAGAIAEVLPFAAGHEFSVEIDPNELDDIRLDALAAAGMTRASVGVQDFDPEVQKAIGRQQSYERTARTVAAIRARGVTSLNIDLLYGLPHQTEARIIDGVEKVLSLRPDRVALYGYAHVPWMARRQELIPVEALPGPEARLQLATAAAQQFTDMGYQAIGIDHFALPDDRLAIAARDGRLRRNFQGYTDDAAPVLIGLGASAISRYRQGHAQNHAATGAYQAAIRRGGLATARGHAFAGDDLLRGRIIESLMCDFQADLAALALECGATLSETHALLAGLEAKLPGTTLLDGDVLSIALQARPLTRIIASHFDAFQAPATSYSQAV